MSEHEEIYRFKYLVDSEYCMTAEDQGVRRSLLIQALARLRSVGLDYAAGMLITYMASDPLDYIDVLHVLLFQHPHVIYKREELLALLQGQDWYRKMAHAKPYYLEKYL